MAKERFWLNLLGVGFLAVLSGCQTWHPETGQTLPSPRYLDHPPQFIPPSPPFPLPKEMDTLQKAAAQAAANALPPIP